MAKRRFLTRDEIIATVMKLKERADKLDVQFAVIGGALFKLLGIEGYETKDIDIAATDYLDLKPVKNAKNEASFAPIGHYKVDGVPVDWMPCGREGSSGLFAHAVEKATVSSQWAKDIPLASLDAAVAIKLYAGRPDDISTVEWFIDHGLVDRNTVERLIKLHCKPPKDVRKEP